MAIKKTTTKKTIAKVASKINKGDKLLIVESPAKAKTISKYLGGEYTVVASVGHVRDLPKNNKKAIDIEGGFIPHYEISPGKEKVISDIRSLAKVAKEVVLATDPDREGEAIAWHIKEAIGLKNPKRVVFYEITEGAVQEAIKHPREIDENLRKAQEARRVLDRLVGYDLSGLIWKKVRYGLSAGRVQSPALRIIMEREREIRAFIPENYYVITAEMKTKDDADLSLTCTEEPRDKKEAERIVEVGKHAGETNSWKVIDVEETEVKRSAKAPFITSTLQQAASTRLGYAPSRTMGLAQKLYEGGHITYMRTDSTNLSSIAVTEAARVIEHTFGKEYVSIKTFASKSKNAQEAHEAIRPSHLSTESAGSNDDEKRLYKLIRARTLASQMSDAKLARTKITANIENLKESIPHFTITGSRVIFDGWLRADPDARGEDVELPPVKKDEPLKLVDISSLEKTTEPPSRYTEAGLIKELEKRGIGRPSTYASTIRTLEEREYVTKVNKALFPTDTGDVVSSFLEQNFMQYINDGFTATMEDKLDDIAVGKAEYLKTLKDFYGPFLKDVKSKEKIDKLTNLGDADSKYVCPKCGSPMTVKLSRGGKFLSCSRYPDCDGALTIEGKEIQKDTPIGNDPETGLPIFTKIGRFGPYVQLGEKTKENKKPRMASIPKSHDPEKVSLPDALKFLSLPRKLGTHPDTGKTITASVGRFGPYIVHDADFRSLKTDDVYAITHERAMEILREPKKVGRGGWKKKTPQAEEKKEN
ncbi:MAG: type I DNA topoisomerase [Patescibacteria group bacterium]